MPYEIIIERTARKAIQKINQADQVQYAHTYLSTKRSFSIRFSVFYSNKL